MKNILNHLVKNIDYNYKRNFDNCDNYLIMLEELLIVNFVNLEYKVELPNSLLHLNKDKDTEDIKTDISLREYLQYIFNESNHRTENLEKFIKKYNFKIKVDIKKFFNDFQSKIYSFKNKEELNKLIKMDYINDNKEIFIEYLNQNIHMFLFYLADNKFISRQNFNDILEIFYKNNFLTPQKIESEFIEMYKKMSDPTTNYKIIETTLVLFNIMPSLENIKYNDKYSFLEKVFLDNANLSFSYNKKISNNKEKYLNFYIENKIKKDIPEFDDSLFLIKEKEEWFKIKYNNIDILTSLLKQGSSSMVFDNILVSNKGFNKYIEDRHSNLLAESLAYTDSITLSNYKKIKNRYPFLSEKSNDKGVLDYLFDETYSNNRADIAFRTDKYYKILKEENSSVLLTNNIDNLIFLSNKNLLPDMDYINNKNIGFLINLMVESSCKNFKEYIDYDLPESEKVKESILKIKIQHHINALFIQNKQKFILEYLESLNKNYDFYKDFKVINFLMDKDLIPNSFLVEKKSVKEKEILEMNLLENNININKKRI